MFHGNRKDFIHNLTSIARTLHIRVQQYMYDLTPKRMDTALTKYVHLQPPSLQDLRTLRFHRRVSKLQQRVRGVGNSQRSDRSVQPENCARVSLFCCSVLKGYWMHLIMEQLKNKVSVWVRDAGQVISCGFSTAIDVYNCHVLWRSCIHKHCTIIGHVVHNSQLVITHLCGYSGASIYIC